MLRRGSWSNAQVHALRALGWVFFAIGAAGIVVPLLPTTVFWILAAACWARGAPGLRARLLASPRFGGALSDWFERGAISRRGKVFAIAGMTAGCSAGVWGMDLSPRASLLVAVPVVAAAVWIGTRPGVHSGRGGVAYQSSTAA